MVGLTVFLSMATDVNATAPLDAVTLHALIPLIRERLVTLDDVIPFAGFFFKETVSPAVADLLGKKLTAADAHTIARRSLEILSALPDLAHATAEPPMRALVDELGQNAGAVFGLVRVAVESGLRHQADHPELLALREQACAEQEDTAGLIDTLERRAAAASGPGYT